MGSHWGSQEMRSSLMNLVVSLHMLKHPHPPTHTHTHTHIDVDLHFCGELCFCALSFQLCTDIYYWYVTSEETVLSLGSCTLEQDKCTALFCAFSVRSVFCFSMYVFLSMLLYVWGLTTVIKPYHVSRIEQHETFPWYKKCLILWTRSADFT